MSCMPPRSVSRKLRRIRRGLHRYYCAIPRSPVIVSLIPLGNVHDNPSLRPVPLGLLCFLFTYETGTGDCTTKWKSVMPSWTPRRRSGRRFGCSMSTGWVRYDIGVGNVRNGTAITLLELSSHYTVTAFDGVHGCADDNLHGAEIETQNNYYC